MRPLPSVILCALGAIATPAFAWPTVDVTASEVLSVDPPRVRTTFEIGSSGYEPGCGRHYFEITPIDAQTIHFFECAAPPGWNCGGAIPSGSDVVYFGNPRNAPGFSFSIVTEQAAPCVEFFDEDPVLARTATGGVNYSCEMEGCLVLDAPIPVGATLWGKLKVQYR